MFPAFPQNRNPETDATTSDRDGNPVEGSIHRATTFTPCIGCAAIPLASVKKTLP
jgi:hypothetical protein